MKYEMHAFFQILLSKFKGGSMKQNALVTFRSTPFSPLYLFTKEFERDYFDNPELGINLDEGINYLETDEAYLATVDIPGVNPADLSIELIENKIIITGERKKLSNKNNNETKKYNFSLNIPKSISEDSINAHYENGVLSLTLPKQAEQKNKRKIDISTGKLPSSWCNFLNFKKAEVEKN